MTPQRRRLQSAASASWSSGASRGGFAKPAAASGGTVKSADDNAAPANVSPVVIPEAGSKSTTPAAADGRRAQRTLVASPPALTDFVSNPSLILIAQAALMGVANTVGLPRWHFVPKRIFTRHCRPTTTASGERVSTNVRLAAGERT